MKYQVLDGNKPAQFPNHQVHESWNNSIFNTYVEALNYAHKWLGEYSPGRVFQLNKKYDYSGYGDYIQIIKL